MTKCTKDAARYPNREEAINAYISCKEQCRKDYKDNDEISKCFAECREGDWSFERDVKLSEQVQSLLDESNDALSGLYTVLEDLSLMGL